MKQNKEWTNVMRDVFRDAEATPPADGWARLERELGSIPAPRVPAWRVYRTRIAAAAALVACVVTGGYLWHTAPDPAGFDGNVIASAAGGGQTVTEQLETQVPEDGNQPLENSLPTTVIVADASVAKARPKVRIAHAEAPAAFGCSPATTDAQAVELQTEVPAADASAGQTGELPVQPGQHSKSRAVTRSAAKASADEEARSLHGDDFVAHTPPRKKISLSLNAGGAVTGATSATGSVGLLMADGANMLPGDDGPILQPLYRFDYPESSFRHHQPLSFGVSVRKEFAYGLSLESGVNYTLLRSDVDLKHGTKGVNQKLHFIGIPLRLNWQFLERGRFSLYIGAGGMVEKCVAANFGTRDVAEPGVQWSVLGAAGAQYRLGGVVGLYFEPEASYYFTDTNLRTSRTDSPVTLTLRLGVRLSF